VTNRARARYAITWRPRFPAVLALSRSQLLACKSAKVSQPTARKHRAEDADFEAQCVAAEEHAVQLLHDVTFRSALEGDCEPVFWQRIQVGHVRKFDNRLRIEMLRTHMPGKFKTPGSRQPLVSGDGNQVIVIDEATRAELARLGRKLDAMERKK
jgi:hypothetical protein